MPKQGHLPHPDSCSYENIPILSGNLSAVSYDALKSDDLWNDIDSDREIVKKNNFDHLPEVDFNTDEDEHFEKEDQLKKCNSVPRKKATKQTDANCTLS